MEIAFVQVDDDVRLQSGRDRKKNAEHSGIHITLMPLLWPSLGLSQVIYVVKSS